DEPTHPADQAVRDHAAEWGIWPDDHYPSNRPEMPLAEQFSRQIGRGESVEYWEVFGLARNVAHSAYAASANPASAYEALDQANPSYTALTFPSDMVLRQVIASRGIWTGPTPCVESFAAIGEQFAT